MGGETRQTALLETVYRRQQLLRRLASTPARSATLAEELDPTRSTIDRGLSELESAELVDCVDGQYRTTVAGELALAQFDRLTDRLEDAVTTRPLLGSLPADTPLNPQFIDGSVLIFDDDGQTPVADGTVSVESTEPQTALEDIFDAGRRHRIYLPVFERRLVDPCLEAVHTSTTVEIVLSDAIIDDVLGHFRRSTGSAIGSGQLTLFETSIQLPYALFVTELDDESGVASLPFGCASQTLVALASCTDEMPAGLIANDQPAAIEWTTTKLTTICENAKRLAIVDRS